ncbi:MAG: hypothetical protein OXF61_04635 [Acidimicrobiaceae bacterium]|nr:hypothetical protein [Acidimicrobiaceae bacterium]
MDQLALRRWDPVEHLETPADAVAYLDAALEDGDPRLVAAVLGDIARAAAEHGTQTDKNI